MIIMTRKEKYSIINPEIENSNVAMLVPGMACNRYGHPSIGEPCGLFGDIAGAIDGEYKVVFPDIHEIPYNACQNYEGKTVERQADCLREVYKDVGKNMSKHENLLLVGQSLGALAIAEFLRGYDDSFSNTRIAFVAPPTSTSVELRNALVRMFAKSKYTAVDDRGIGVLGFGGCGQMHVEEEYWRSIETCAEGEFVDLLEKRSDIVTMIYAKNDKYFCNNENYINKLKNTLNVFAVDGCSHAFKPEAMRKTAVNILKGVID